jgi:hypothetical protein
LRAFVSPAVRLPVSIRSFERSSSTLGYIRTAPRCRGKGCRRSRRCWGLGPGTRPRRVRGRFGGWVRTYCGHGRGADGALGAAKAIRCAGNCAFGAVYRASRSGETALGVPVAPIRVGAVYRVIINISKDISLSALKQDRILTHPPADGRIVIPRPKPNEPRIPIVNPARKSERLKPRVRIDRHVTPRIIVHALSDCTGRSVHNEPHAAALV